MRKILITLIVLIVAGATVSIGWLFGGHQMSLFADRFGTIETNSSPVHSLIYKGSGTGGVLAVNDLRLNLDPAIPQQEPPHIGTSKDGELAISFGGKVFPFGPLPAAIEGSDDVLATAPPADDNASIRTRRSALGWIETLKLPPLSCTRYFYYELVWRKPSGAKLEMLWRFERDETNATDTIRPGSTQLIKIDIGI